MDEAIKIEIRNRWNGAVIYSHIAPENTVAITMRSALESNADLSGADLRNADLRNADLRNADLRNADLSGADLSNADLSGADLRNADLSGADLTPIRDDIWAILSAAPKEVPALIAALKAGRVDGSTYEGECSCLVGTIAAARGTGVDNLGAVKPNCLRPAERFFMGISRGDTPETNQFSALALQWSEQWLANMREAFAA